MLGKDDRVMSYREGKDEPCENVTNQFAGICKTNGKIDWDNTGRTPAEEFNFIANMIDTYLEEHDRGSEGANQDG